MLAGGSLDSLVQRGRTANACKDLVGRFAQQAIAEDDGIVALCCRVNQVRHNGRWIINVLVLSRCKPVVAMGLSGSVRARMLNRSSAEALLSTANATVQRLRKRPKSDGDGDGWLGVEAEDGGEEDDSLPPLQLESVPGQVTVAFGLRGPP